jgi:hypothetical protein
MTIPLRDFSDQMPSLISRWFRDEPKLRPVYNLLVGTIHRPDQYVQSIYLSLMQGLESFHRLAYAGHYESEEVYDKLKTALLGAIPGDTSNDLKEKMKNTLKYANQYSLRKRLRELLKILGSTALASLLSRESEKEFIGKLVDLRNYLTHYDESSAPNIVSLANNLIEMYNLNRKLRAFLSGLLLAYLGLDQQHVNKLFSLKNLELAQ